ncbi:MAG TPA: ABC transporter permease [Solirubrobacterales bacterium]|jgi:NitT/TauT family transport system permease protein|nr:ABC transporter permease [Solirubrobacterales bacterium]
MATEVGVGMDPARPVTPDAGPSFRERMRERGIVSTILWPTVSLIAILLIWEWLSKTGRVDEIIVPAPTDIAEAFVDLVQETFFWEATWVTVQETVIGFGAGVLGAWILGTLIGVFRPFRLAFYPLVVVFQITPRVALAPVFLTWFGFGITSKIVMAATICFFPVLINVVLGLETVDRDARDLMRSFGASKWEEYRKLTLPSSLPAIFAGLKVAITLALIGAIVAEFVGATEGMGVLIKTFNFQLQVAEGFAVILALSIIGLILYGITELLESKIVFWRGH